MSLNDLATGTQAEEYVASLFDDSKVVGHKRWPWDVEVAYGHLIFTIEVKYDLYEAKSGNIAIEYWNSKQDKPSGISATEADFWCQALKDSAWIIHVDELKNFCRTAPPHKHIEKGGDNNAALLIYQRDHILEIFTRIDNLPRRELLSLCLTKIT